MLFAFKNTCKNVSNTHKIQFIYQERKLYISELLNILDELFISFNLQRLTQIGYNSLMYGLLRVQATNLLKMERTRGKSIGFLK